MGLWCGRSLHAKQNKTHILFTDPVIVSQIDLPYSYSNARVSYFTLYEHGVHTNKQGLYSSVVI